MSFELPHSAEAPGRARVLVAVHSCPEHAQEALPAVQLVASELTTCALLYGTPPMTVTLSCEVGHLRVSVTHGVPAGLKAESLPVDGADGLRSALLDKLAREWGIRRTTGDGRELWSLTPTGHLPARRPPTQVPSPLSLS